MAAAGGLGDDQKLAALRDALAAVGAKAPRLVYRKELHKSDLDANQRHLLISDDGDARVLTVFLTADEKDRVHEDYGSFPKTSWARKPWQRWRKRRGGSWSLGGRGVFRSMVLQPKFHAESGYQHPDGVLGVAILVRN
ncbi:hypothetical protein HU200_008268 [Digitaria exilis]|uniref:Uncharacterized protein n=1 Tax=Digitaria exilis TaxID=1010633 RepID=A0A835FN69_9POAL|nr:hypothetical protein HU200_008268 [Digitaria exilis]